MLIVFCNYCGVVHCEFLPPAQIVKKIYFLIVMKAKIDLKEEIKIFEVINQFTLFALHSIVYIEDKYFNFSQC